MKHPIYFFILFLLVGCSKKPNLITEYQLQDPYDFVIEAFDTCQVVLLGESHRIKQHQDFVSELIPKLSENGINNLVTEFCRYEDTPLLDSLMQMQEFDFDLAKKIMINHNWSWQYQEYIDILESAWKVNQTSKNPFRVIGMNHSQDYNLTREDKAFWKWTEKDFADRIEKEVLDKQEKAIVHCGVHHSLTRYVQPEVDSLGNLTGFYPEKGRVGHVLYRRHKNKVSTIWLHSPLYTKNMNDWYIKPLDGKLDSIYNVIQKPYAFNTHTSGLGKIVEEESYYAVGYPGFNLERIADGYIVPCSFKEYEFVSRIPDFADSANWAMIKKQIRAFELVDDASLKEANDMLKTWYNDNKSGFEETKDKYWR